MASNAPIITKQRYTYEDYLKLPEGAPYQLIGGELIMSPSPSLLHQMVLAELFNRLWNFVKAQNLGLVLCAPMDVYLSEAETYQPDIFFISAARNRIISDKKIEGAPDLIIEILSPSTAYYDLKHKMKQYEVAGVQEYWIVDPEEKNIEVYRPVANRFQIFSEAQKSGTAASGLLIGFEVSLADLFK